MQSISNDYIYLDYAATSPLCEEASDAISKYLFGGRDNIISGTNANSLSSPGRLAFKDMQASRKKIAQALGCRGDEIIFTSGATEADNMAVKGISQAVFHEREMRSSGTFTPNIITTEIEHDAVLAPAAQMKKAGFEVRLLKPDRGGRIAASTLEDAIDNNTVLVSIQMANSEIGTVQNIKQLAGIAHSVGALFHTDATQALGKVPIDLGQLDVDAASFSAHKVGGPKGMGLLFKKRSCPIEAQMLGGGQESGLRSGTQNVMGISGMCASIEAAVAKVDTEALRLAALRDKLYSAYSMIDGIRATVDVENGSTEYLPNIVSAIVEDIESETLILRFDSLGFAVSGGSACSSMSLDPSHVLTSIGIDGDSALCALRVSMGRYTTEADIDAFIEAIPKVLNW